MYCKNCGKTLVGNPRQCDECGAQVVYDGGNSFWDIAMPEPTGGSPSGTDKAVLNALGDIRSKLDRMQSVKPGPDPDPVPRPRAVATAVLIALAAACLLLCTANLLSLNRLNAQMRSDAQATEASLEALRVAVETTPEPQATPAPPLPLVIKEATGETQAEGWEGALFTVELCFGGEDTGQYTVQWQRESGGTYRSLSEGDLARLGLAAVLPENEGRHLSYGLWAKGLTVDAQGNYRLAVISIDSPDAPAAVSEPVTLIVEAAPEPTPEPTPGEQDGDTGIQGGVEA